VLVRAEECWFGRWLGPTLLEASGDSLTLVGPAEARMTGADLFLPGTLFGGFTDSHVHLGLIDPSLLLPGGIAAVDDLGWIPGEAALWSARPETEQTETERMALPGIRYAGAFLAAVGGYPSDRSWAPPGSVVEVTAAEAAAEAVAAQLAAGAGFIKITLNSSAGPVFDDATLGAIVTAAHSSGVTVVAHAEGAGQAARAFEAGVDRLAHAPFDELLPDELLTSMAGRLEWISTLDIHGYGDRTRNFELAVQNVRRFAALGGDIRYGTDLGNGPLPVGINRRELAALAESGVETVASITPRPTAEFGKRSSFAGGIPTDTNDLAAWLATAVVLATTDLEASFS
jgi:hypothetical protein